MRKTAWALSGLAALLVIPALWVLANPGDRVSPATAQVINTRGENVAALSGSYVKTSTVIFTNCYCYDANSNTQGLDNVEVEITIGNASYGVTVYTATVYSVGVATNFWQLQATVPNIAGTTQVQTKLTDENSNVFIYPLKTMSTVAEL
jgi:hypothetical protein